MNVTDQNGKAFRLNNDGTYDLRFKYGKKLAEQEAREKKLKQPVGKDYKKMSDSVKTAKTRKTRMREKWARFKKRLGIFCLVFIFSSVTYTTYTIGMIPVRYFEQREATRIANIKRPVIYSCLSSCGTQQNDIEVVAEPKETKPVSAWEGQASWYGESDADCLGCRADRLTASGERFNENAMTLAFNWLPMGTKVTVRNLANGEIVEATVNDTGGFNELGRIADLSKGLKNRLNCSDLCNVEVRKVNEDA